jgi:hypothetical protein
MRELRNDTLERFLAAPGRFAVYGAGSTGEAVVQALAELGLKPSAFLDGYATGERAGLEILPPEGALGLDCVVTAGHHARDMTVQLRADGFEGPVIDLSEAHRDPAPPHFDEACLDAAKDEIGFARSLLEHDGSREILDGVLRYRRCLDPGELPPAPPTARHPEVGVADGEWLIVVGADAEACLELARAVGPLGRVHVLEPCVGRRRALGDAAGASALGGRLSIHALACGARCRDAADGGDDAPPVVTVDEFVWEPTAGRVERLCLGGPGARAALTGAGATLAEHRPCVELDVSTGPTDLWELAIQLKEQLSGCRLHLSHHSQGLAGTVCYARPSGGA